MKKQMLFALLCLTLLFSACGRSPSPGGTPDLSSPSAPASDVPAPDPSAPAGASYYGKFTVTDCVAFAPVSALSPADAEAYLNTELEYADTGFRSGTNNCDTPVYQESQLTPETFSEEYNDQLHFSDLGLEGDPILNVSVDGCDFFGSNFFVKDADTLIIPSDGGFFVAERTV